MTEQLTIGRLARAAGVNIETIRYYQRIGLIDEPVKPIQGYRHYPATTIEADSLHQTRPGPGIQPQ